MTHKLLTRTQFISLMRKGGTVQVEAEDGMHTIAKSEDRLGFYKVDGKSDHALIGLYDWLGFYHVDYGEAVINAKEL